MCFVPTLLHVHILLPIFLKMNLKYGSKMTRSWEFAGLCDERAGIWSSLFCHIDTLM